MASWNCTIPGVSLKVFGRAIQSLSKIGDELYLEPLEDGLYLRSVNSCRSAYACFQFSPSFFVHYVNAVMSAGTAGGGGEDVLRCKLGMKSIMAMFKSLSTMDKTVEKCKISLDDTEERLVFQMYCRHGIIKTHKLAFTECETLQAVFSKSLCPNKLTASPKLLCDAVTNFQNNQEEITLIVRPDFVALKNYVDDELDSTRVVHTELTLSPDEFDHYQAGVDADVTFCLKELRAILAFADITGLPVSLHFEAAGRPITFSITSDLSFEANFVLATLAEEMESSQTETIEDRRQALAKDGSHKKNSSHSNNKHTEKRKNSTNATPRSQNPPPKHFSSITNRAGPSTAVDEMAGDDMTFMMDVTAPEESYMSQMPVSTSNVSATEKDQREDDTCNGVHAKEGDDSQIEQLKASKNIFNPLSSLSMGSRHGETHRGKEISKVPDAALNKLSYNSHVMTQQQGSGNHGSDDLQSHSGKLLSQKSTGNGGDDGSPIIPLQNTHKQFVSNDEENNDDDNDDDEVPSTPPNKKFRSLFFGTQSSTQSTQSQKKAVILAPDSEEDD